MVSVLDGKGNLADMTYDALSRMTLRCWTNNNPGDAQTCPHPSATEVKETWSYDPANGIGEIGGETSSNGTGYAATHTYNSASPTLGLLGQPATSNIVIGSTTFPYSYGYDTVNRPFYYSAPSGALPITVHNTYGYVSVLVDGYGGPPVWTPNSRDAEGHLTSATFGNGTTAAYGYDPATGRMKTLITTATATDNDVLNSIGYTWDQLDNLTQRNDIGNSIVENYSYDDLNRLTSITLPNNGNATENSFTYDSLGNMLTKLDVGTYTYPAAGAPQPHGVASITGTPGTTTFAYDSDGNVTAETGATTRSLGWTMFNMPSTISYGSKTISFQYDADHNRVMQTAPSGTTYYLPDGEQTPGASTGPVWHTYFLAEGERVVEDFGPTGSLKHHFFHNDYQNTIGLVTDDTFTEAGWPSGTGIVQNELSDVFGQPRLHTGAIDPNWGAADVTKRRYINQEDLTPVQLINLNARVYDPLLGKFMSPDPVISDQDDSQSWNAYSYVHNSPMSDTDPTGLGGINDECNGGCIYSTLLATGGFNPQMWNAAQGNFGLFLHTPAGDTQVTAQNGVDLSARGVYSTPDAASTQLDYINSIAHTLSLSTHLALYVQKASQWSSHVAVPFFDDYGAPVLVPGTPRQMMRPQDVDPHYFVDQGEYLAGAGLPSGSGMLGLRNFGRGQKWDAQRVGDPWVYDSQFVDFANTAIGLYAAGGRIPQWATMWAANQVAKSSQYAPDVKRDVAGANLSRRDANDIRLGYDLYNSKRVRSSPFY